MIQENILASSQDQIPNNGAQRKWWRAERPEHI